VDTLRRIAAAAYQPYVVRIGRAPAPMTADYAQAVRDRQVWVAVEDGQVTGFVVLVARPGYLLLENVAVLPAAQGRGSAAASWAWRRRMPANWAAVRSASTPTRP
jgi:GNAT superfamily N-acetyltransferase